MSISTITATLYSGSSLSSGVNLNGGIPVGFQMPATWDSADLTFQAGVDGVTYQNVYDDAGVEVGVTVAAGRCILGLQPLDFSAVWYVKVRSGTSGSPINQSGDRDIILVLRA